MKDPIRLWKCSYCGHNMESKIQFALEHTQICKKKHDLSQNIKTSIECNHCSEKVSSVNYPIHEEICNHLFKYSRKSGKEYQCLICSIKIVSRDTMYHHLKTDHSDNVDQNNKKMPKTNPMRFKKWKCEYCKELVKSPQHTMSCKLYGKFIKKTNGKYKCRLCNFKKPLFYDGKKSSLFKMFSHVKRSHPDDSMETKLEKTSMIQPENTSLLEKTSLKKHELIHTKKENINTDYDFSLKETESKIKPDKRKISCQSCEKSFNLYSSLKRHEMIHTGEKPFKCQFCNKTFRLKQHVTVHERCHTGEKPFICKICDKGFVDYSNKKEHERTCISKRPEENSDFSSFKKNMNKMEDNAKEITLLQNTEKIKRKCDYCEKIFNKHIHYSQHVKTCALYIGFLEKTSTGFNCLICLNKTVLNIHSMYEHIRNMHSDDSNFKKNKKEIESIYNDKESMVLQNTNIAIIPSQSKNKEIEIKRSPMSPILTKQNDGSRKGIKKRNDEVSNNSVNEQEFTNKKLIQGYTIISLVQIGPVITSFVNHSIPHRTISDHLAAFGTCWDQLELVRST